MKLHVLSDLHLSQAGFDAPATDADVVILAGDIARPREAIAFARRFAQPVLYVAGNHEFYGASMESTRALLRELCEGTNVHLLDDGELRLQGVRFLGTTLWTDFDIFGQGAAKETGVAAATRFIRDFQRIRLRDDDDTLLTPAHSQALFRRHAAWLEQRLAEPHEGSTVVITHHAPSARSIHPRFAGAPVNVCFVSDLERLLGRDRCSCGCMGTRTTASTTRWPGRAWSATRAAICARGNRRTRRSIRRWFSRSGRPIPRRDGTMA